jgi:Tfp pilus assembly protein PilO
VSLTDRDKKMILLIVPALLIAAYWFLIMSPKRDAVAEAESALAVQVERRDFAQQRAATLAASRSRFAADYAELVRLGKAVPPTVDMPTILVQLDAAAKGTEIVFTKVTAEEREPAAAPATPPPGSGDGSQPADAGGAAAQSGPGSAGESAGNAVADANANSNASAAQSGVNPSDTATSETVRDGALPVGGGAATPGAATSAPALDTVPLTFEFVGGFFDLADFFHRVKRYVETSKGDIDVRGRLITVDGIEFKSEPDLFPSITATLTATAYLAPEAEGATAGATPSGPEAVPASTDGESSPTVSAPPTPTATATR